LVLSLSTGTAAASACAAGSSASPSSRPLWPDFVTIRWEAELFLFYFAYSRFAHSMRMLSARPRAFTFRPKHPPTGLVAAPDPGTPLRGDMAALTRPFSAWQSRRSTPSSHPGLLLLDGNPLLRVDLRLRRRHGPGGARWCLPPADMRLCESGCRASGDIVFVPARGGEGGGPGAVGQRYSWA
jgi:hypothetical protein